MLGAKPHGIEEEFLLLGKLLKRFLGNQVEFGQAISVVGVIEGSLLIILNSS